MDTEDLHLPATRKAAQEAGSTFFFTGRPCIRGHVSRRRTSNKACLLCARTRQNAANARPEAKAKRQAQDRQRFIENRGYFDAKNRRYYAEHTERHKAVARAYRERELARKLKTKI